MIRNAKKKSSTLTPFCGCSNSWSTSLMISTSAAWLLPPYWKLSVSTQSDLNIKKLRLSRNSIGLCIISTFLILRISMMTLILIQVKNHKMFRKFPLIKVMEMKKLIRTSTAPSTTDDKHPTWNRTINWMRLWKKLILLEWNLWREVKVSCREASI